MSYSLAMFNKNLIKLIKAIDLLAGSGGTTVEALSAELELSRRSVFRMIKTMREELNFPIEDDRSEFGGKTRYWLMDRFVTRLSNVILPRLSLSLQEATLLYFLLGRDEVFKDSEIAADLASLREKLGVLLPKSIVSPSADARLDSLFAASAGAMKSYAGKEHLLDTVFDALEQRLECSLTYRSLSQGEAKTYAIQPLKLIEHRGGLYLFIRIPKHDSIRIIALDRIDSIELGDKPFCYPESFDAEALLDSAFDLTFDDPITAVIRFSAKDSPYVKERRYGGTVHFEEHTDGSLRMTITTSGQEDLLRWILSFGGGAEILEPPELRERARNELARACAQYEVKP
jgi:predicted DNA-binding transcriptional regulator YafY